MERYVNLGLKYTSFDIYVTIEAFAFPEPCRPHNSLKYLDFGTGKRRIVIT